MHTSADNHVITDETLIKLLWFSETSGKDDMFVFNFVADSMNVLVVHFVLYNP